MHCRPDFPRIIGDIDILVPFEQYEKAKNIVLPMYNKHTEYKHSVDIYDDVYNIPVLDLHKKLDLQTPKEILIGNELFKRTHKEKVFGVEDICVPSVEDMLFITLINMNKNLMRNTYYNLLYSIIDCAYLLSLKSDFDWDIVKKNAILTQTESQIAIVIKFLNEYIPTKMPVIFTEEFNKRTILRIYKDIFLDEMHAKSHELTIKNIKSWSSLKYYIKFRAQYTLFKRKFVRSNANFAKMILIKQGFIK